MKNHRIRFEHFPDGAMHPYRRVDYERMPAHPAAGQNTKLGVKVIAEMPVEQVWVEFSLGSEGAPQRVEAVKIAEEDAVGYWSATLPSLRAGETCQYQFLADSTAGQAVSEVYRFDVLASLSLETVSRVVQEENAVTIEYAADWQGLRPVLRYDLLADESIQGSWELRQRTADRESEGALVGDLYLGPFRFAFSEHTGGMVISHRACGVLLEEQRPTVLTVDRDGGIWSVEQRFNSPEEEAFYGFGERFNALDQRGNSLDNVVYEQFTGQGKLTYIPMPYFLSSRGYALYFETDRNMLFDLAETNPGIWQYAAEAGGEKTFSFRLWASLDPKQTVAQACRKFGKAKLPPNWVFGLWMSANSWNNYREVMDEVQRGLDEEIPATVVVLEAWADETTFYLWNDAEFVQKPSSQAYRYEEISFPEDKRWPDPKKMCDDLHAMGMRLVLWQVPVLKGLLEEDRFHGHQAQHKADWDYLVDKRYCLHTTDQKPYLIPDGNWFRYSLVPDFNQGEAAAWWLDRRRYLVEEVGIDGMKTDGGEHIIRSDVVSINGERSDTLRNTYTRLYQQKFAEFFERFRGDDMVLFSRSGYTGAQQYSCHWAGDQDSSWEAFQSCIFAGVSAGISGFSFWGWDIGGFARELPSAELYLRSTAMAAFCPIMQYHSVPNDHPEVKNTRTPWNIAGFDPSYDVVEIFRKFVNARMNLLPYIVNEARLSSDSGLPLMRSVPIFFPDEPESRQYPYQYLFGSDLLVAPIVEPGVQEWEVYLPEGDWFNLWTGDKVTGGRVVVVDAQIDSIPVFVKSGAILPMNLDESLQLGSYVGNMTDEFQNFVLVIYPEEGGEIEFRNFKTGQTTALHYQLVGNTLQLSVESSIAPLYLKFANLRVDRVMLEGQELPKLRAAGRHGWWMEDDYLLVQR